MTNPPIQDNPAAGSLTALAKTIDEIRDVAVASDAAIKAQGAALAAVESRLAALEAKPPGGGVPAVTVDITEAQSAQLAGVPLGSLVELRAPDGTEILAMRAQP